MLLKTELQKAQNNLQKIKTNASGKSVDYSNDVFIDTDNVTYIEYGAEYYSYTFNLIRENTPESTLVENLVLSPLTDGTFKELLVTYTLTQQEKKDIFSGKSVNTKGKTTITELAKGTYGGMLSGKSSCNYETVDMIFSCYTGDHHQGNESTWGGCNWESAEGGYPPLHITMVALVCGADTSLGDDGAPGGGGTGNPGGGGGNPDTETPTIPTLSTFSIYVKNLPPDLKVLINDTANSDFYNGIKAFYDFNNDFLSKEVIRWALQFKQNNSISWEDFQPILLSAYNFLLYNELDTVNPEQIFTRIRDLDNALVQNPNLLLDISCAQLGQLDDWSSVATHQVPQSVIDKMQNIKNQTSYYDNWKITDLDNGMGARLNMDLFPVNITSMPNKPNGQKYTHAEFFDYFRKNINQFAEKFEPIQDTHYGIDDIALWFSNNPLGALIHIKIPLDDGTVVCSGYWTNSWMFSTVKAPLDWYHDGVYPVAGNRLFSYYIDPTDNAMYIYTRGVDRVSHNFSNTAIVTNHILESMAFKGADNLWEDMQDKLSNYVSTHGGAANKVTAVKYRPRYSKIKDYIKGKIPISSLGCN